MTDFSNTTDLAPPSNIEAEQYLLGSLLFDPKAIEKILLELDPEFFYLLAHQIICRAIIKLYRLGSPIDYLHIVNLLTDEGTIDKIGSTMVITSLLDVVVSTAGVEDYLRIIKEKYLRRQLIEIGDRIKCLAFDPHVEVKQALAQSEKLIFDLSQSDHKNSLIPLSEIAPELFEDISEAIDFKKELGIGTGLVEVDRILGGLHRSDLTIVAGRPGSGKTALCVNLAVNIAQESSLPVAIFSLEMARQQLGLRMLSAQACIDSNRLKSGIISDLEENTLIAAIGELSELPIYINDASDLSVFEIASECRKLQTNCDEALGLILIDYLQIMHVESDNHNIEFGKITKALKGLAKELNVPILLLSQLSRGVESRQDKRPLMSDLRSSGAIEQDADIVMMLYRDDYYNPDSEEKGLAELNIIKHRNGSTGTVKLIFRKEYTQFLNCKEES